MSLAKFLESPWANSHNSYDGSAFNIRPAPENATAEVVVASTYRASGFAGHAERIVPATGSRLAKEAKKKLKGDDEPRISAETWLTILHGALESPKRPKQSSRRFVQLTPIIPDVALYSGSARLTGNSWNPGQLVERMVLLGCESRLAAETLWRDLHGALSVAADDDVWARWLQAEFERRRFVDITWSQSLLPAESSLPDKDKHDLRPPASEFVRDLSSVLQAKPFMTRRQWVSLLEAILRLGTVAHVLWLCDLNDRLWRTTRKVLAGGPSVDRTEFQKMIVENRQQYLVYGQPALPIIRDLASRYLESRLGLNLVLWQLEDLGHSIPSLSSISDVISFLEVVEKERDRLDSVGVSRTFDALVDSQPRTVACKKGIGSNIVEFCRYTLGQRETADDNLRGFDQGYLLRKRAEYKSAPWVVSLGPVALLALVHCCLAEAAGPRSVHRLCEHLARYGLDVDRDDIAMSDLGRNLRMLGLILDSPDAESGMLLIRPFETGRGDH